MTDGRNTERRGRGRAESDAALEQRRLRMKGAEGHEGSTPRGNPDLEHEKTDERRGELERLLGH